MNLINNYNLKINKMEKRNYTQEEILFSKGYKKGIAFPTPQEYFSNIIEIQPEKFTINLEGSHEIININDDGTENISFGRLHLNYNFNIDDDVRYDLGLIISMDKGKPIAKIYTGLKVKACMNLCIFGADQIFKFDILQSGLDFKRAFEMQFQEIEKHIKRGKEIREALKSIHLSHVNVLKTNGYVLEDIIKNNGLAGTNPILHAIRLQADERHLYYAKNGLNAWLYLNSLTEYLEQKIHALDIPEKSLNLFLAIKPFFEKILKPEINTNFQLDLEEEIKLLEIEIVEDVKKSKKENKKKVS